MVTRATAGDPTIQAGTDAAPRDDVSVAVLGPLKVAIGGTPVELGRPKAKLVLARLALASPQIVTVEGLMETLWGDAPPATARKVLQKYVSELRKVLGAATVRSEEPGYALAIDAGRIDALAFHELLARARSARGRGHIRQAWDMYEEALGLWRGPALAGLDDVSFVAAEARRLDAARLGALEDQMEIGLELGKHDELVGTLETLVQRHPLRERLWASLMTALYRSGRQVDALAAYRELHRTLDEELGITPSPELSQLEERILLHDASLDPPRSDVGSGNLPVGFTSFVGRSTEMSELAQLLGDSRFVTLVGPGGAGKTRLAIEIGGTVRNLYPEGVWFVDLAAVSEPAQVVPAAAAAFGLAHERDTPMERTLVDFLAGKRALILLDNCEHIVTGAAALARSVLGATRSVALLATSREPLGLAGETVYKVGPLEIPGEVGAEPEHLAEIDSVRLFIDRASAADPGFRFTAEAGRIVADICHRLDGLPLAIELAARQLHVVGPSELHRSLLDQLDLLEAPGEPDARHRTMEAAIAWSYRLLDEAQRDVFVTLSAFPGSFTAQAVENVCRDAGLMTGRTSVPVLTALVSRSMVLRQRTDDGPRYRLLEPVRAFAAERAFEMGRTHALGRAHAAWTLELLEEDPQIGGAGERERRRWLSAERHHFPVALNWAIGEEPELALRLLVAAGEYVIMDEFLFTEADDLVRAVAAAQDVPRFLKAAALAHGAIGLSERFADYRSARSWAEEALRLSQGAGDARITAISNLALGVALRSAGDLEEARARIHDAITAFGSVGDQAWAALGRHWLSHVETARGNFDIVVQLCEEAVETWRQIGSDWGVARAWWVTAAAMALKGDYDQAESYAARSLELLEGYDDPEIPVHVRAVQGDAARLAGRHERAESIYLECLRDFQGIGDRRCTASTLKNLGSVALKLDRAQDASRLLIAALERRMRLADESGFPECYERLALVAERRGEPELAVALVGGASRLRSQTGATSPEVERAEIAALLSDLRTSLPDERFEVAWARGLELDPADAVAETQRLLGV